MLEVLVRMLLLVLKHLFLGICLQLVKRVKLADILDELVVELRQLLLLDLMELDLEGGVLALELLGIFLREGNVDFKLLARIVADHLLLKARDELVGAERQVVILALAALEGDAVDKALEIDHSHIAVLCSTILHTDVTGVALAHLPDFLVDLFVLDLDIRFLGLQAFIFAELHLRLHSNLHLDDGTVLAHFLYFRIIGLVNRFQAGFLHSLPDRLRVDDLDGVLIKDLRAIDALNEGAGSLALAEAVHGNILFLLEIRFVDSVVKRCGINRYFQFAYTGLFQLGRCF